MRIENNRNWTQRFAGAEGGMAADARQQASLMARVRALADFGTGSLFAPPVSATRFARAPGMARRAENAEMRIENERFWLQRFAEGGAGAAGDAGAAGAAAGAADVGQQVGEAAGKAAAVPDATEKDAGDAKPEAQAPALPSFEELIKGQYKADFDARVQSIVKGRLAKEQKTTAKMQGVLDVLAQRYGKDGTDYDGILDALNGDTALYESEAAAAGMDVTQYMRMKSLERQNEAFRREQKAAQQEAEARREFAEIVKQGEVLKEKFPGFDLKTELQNPSAVKMLKFGIPLETVYEVMHRRELQTAAAAVGAQRVAASVAANKSRPAEAGSGGTGSASASIDPAKLTRAQREDIKRRVQNGERIVLSDYAPK